MFFNSKPTIMPICVTVTFKHRILWYNDAIEDVEDQYRSNMHYDAELFQYVKDHCTIEACRECRDEMLIGILESFKEDGLSTPTVFLAENSGRLSGDEPYASFTMLSDTAGDDHERLINSHFTYWGANGGEHFKIGDKKYEYSIDVEFGGGVSTEPSEAVKKALGGEGFDSPPTDTGFVS